MSSVVLALPSGWGVSSAGFYTKMYLGGGRADIWYVVHDPWHKGWRITGCSPAKVQRYQRPTFLLEGVCFQDPIAAMVATDIELAAKGRKE